MRSSSESITRLQVGRRRKRKSPGGQLEAWRIRGLGRKKLVRGPRPEAGVDIEVDDALDLAEPARQVLSEDAKGRAGAGAAEKEAARVAILPARNCRPNRFRTAE